ncbi:FAD-binding protein, partial [Streptomyces sp. SID339]|nr:FAD-binding protein [Streptomyces sp. SID339]
GRGPLCFGRDLWPLISKEVQCVYYEALLAARDEAPAAVARFAAAFLAAAPGRAEEEVLAAAGIGEGSRWDWEALARPYGSRVFADAAQFTSWLRSHLERDVAQARRGNVRGPLKAALDVLRDLRNEIRLAVDHGGLSGHSHRTELEGWYTPLNAYLSIGPPAGRVEEMLALMEAGVLEVSLPGIRVTAAEGREGEGAGFVGTSALVPGVRVRAGALIEARLPEMDLRRTDDPLLRCLLASGQCRPYRIQDHETGGLAVTRSFHLLDAGGTAHRRRFAYGVPTESVHWVTAAGIRPGVGSVTLEDSDAIAGAVLALPAPARTAAGGPGSGGDGARHPGRPGHEEVRP